MGRQRFGRYEIVEEIGKGSMGVVYKAFDPLLKRRLAIKSMGASAHDDEEFVQRFFREAEATAGLNHPNIVSIYDIGEVDSQPYIAMEYLEGENLGAILNKGAFVPFERKLDVVVQLCEGLEHAHSRGVIHRDVKPSNVLLTPQGRVKIVDFGIAKLLSSNLTTVGQLMGTPSYMAPEQISGGQVDRRSDIFGVGVMLYQLVTGQKPFQGSDFRAVMFAIAEKPHLAVRLLMPACAPALVAIIDRALAKNPEERFETADQLRGELQSLRGELPVLARELQKEVEQLQIQAGRRRAEFTAAAQLGEFGKNILADPQTVDPEQTVFGAAVEKSQDYGYLLARHAQLSQNLARLGQLVQKRERLGTLAAESRDLFEREDWEGCLGRLEEFLEALPESVEAARLKQLCAERIEQARLGRETAIEVEAAFQKIENHLADDEIDEAERVAGEIRARDPENPRLAELAQRLEAAGQTLERRQSLTSQELSRTQQRSDAPRKLRRWGLAAAAAILPAAALSAWLWLGWSVQSEPVVVYQVQAGETLEGLSARFGLAVQALAANNDLGDSGALAPGQILNLGGAPRRHGTLVLDFAPWASIESIVRSEDGAETLRGAALTPVTLHLPAGEYVVKAGNPELGSVLEVTVEVEDGAVLREERPMPGFELQSELDSLLDLDGR